ncbi:Hypothetical predicted protein [Mytilus galloprovincialis]|uniref:Uncharacterized protein n=1 Tax=Mytilus galloprovincialis TaxID=29158 RepID=A0A8B6E865_MYTGA|nr:Hypothetical predicted protein [Mytilus galloprovincialis]
MVARHRLQIQLKALESSIMEQAQRIVNYKIAKELEHSTEKTDQSFSKKVYVYKHQHTGRTSINCRSCKRTCHGGCWVPLDVLTWTCESIVDGKCTVCENNCSIKDHDREKYEYMLTLEKRVFTVAEFVKSFEESFLEFLKTINKVNVLIKELASKALRPDVLSTQGYIEHIIKENNEEKQEDYEPRGKVLTKVRDYIDKGDLIWNLKLSHLIKK